MLHPSHHSNTKENQANPHGANTAGKSRYTVKLQHHVKSHLKITPRLDYTIQTYYYLKNVSYLIVNHKTKTKTETENISVTFITGITMQTLDIYE